MNNERPNAIFNIHGQYGNNTNVAGDMTVHGGQQYMAAPADVILPELTRLRRALAATDLDPDVRELAAKFLTAADQEAGRPQLDERRVAGPLERLTRLLREAGAITAGGAALIDPLQRIASWLGASGQTILHMIT